MNSHHLPTKNLPPFSPSHGASPIMLQLLPTFCLHFILHSHSLSLLLSLCIIVSFFSYKPIPH